MAAHDFTAPRLFVAAGLGSNARVELDKAAANYLLTVLRLGPGDAILVFNGRDGEWRARLEPSGRKSALLTVEAQTRPQPPAPDLVLLFAPLKHARLDYLVQKATEMGAGQIRPVRTRRTVPTRVNEERMRANIVEAAEQCGILSVPSLLPPAELAVALAELEPGRLLVFCDEDVPSANPLPALAGKDVGRGCALLIGPEGGFDDDERRMIRAREPVLPISLGPRILRADTAAVAALAVVQATLGDWR